MSSQDLLEYFRGHWPTNKGAWFPGEKVQYRQQSLFDDFADKSWMTLFIYGITGRMPTQAQARVVEQFWSISTSFPDPRLWNNRVAALAGTARSTAPLAIAAATAISEAKVYGARPLYLGALFLHRLKTLADDADGFEKLVLDKLKKDRYLPGFGRPVISEDERIRPFTRELAAAGLDDGEFISLLKKIESLLQKKRYKLKPNIAIYGAAVFADMGLDPFESYLLVVLTFNAGLFPCFIDSREKREGLFFPMSCQVIHYTGHGKRELKKEPGLFR